MEIDKETTKQYWEKMKETFGKYELEERMLEPIILTRFFIACFVFVHRELDWLTA